MSELDATVDEAKRAALAGQIAAIMNDETPAIIAFFYKTMRPIGKRVKGIDALPTDFLDLRAAWLA